MDERQWYGLILGPFLELRTCSLNSDIILAHKKNFAYANTCIIFRLR